LQKKGPGSNEDDVEADNDDDDGGFYAHIGSNGLLVYFLGTKFL